MIVFLPLVYLATMFLGPVVQVRYVLPIMMIIPLVAAVWAKQEPEVKALEEEPVKEEV